MVMNQKRINNITEVSIGKIQLPGYCSEIKCITITGYIDFGENERIVYLDCKCEKQELNECVFLQIILNNVYFNGGRSIEHRQGSKGQIMDDILDKFNKSHIREIRIPIKTNQEDKTTYPGNMKRAFVILKDLYETEIEHHVIEKIQKDEFVDNYILTLKKIGEPGEKIFKEKLLEPFKVFRSFFSRKGD